MARALDRDAIVDAAIAVAERDGFAAVSMRRVAAELGVGTMSLYWYVPTRDDLLDLMFDRAVAPQVLAEVPADWRTALEQIARGARRTSELAPWASELGMRPRLGPAIIAHVEQSIAVAQSMGLPFDQGMYAVSAVDNYVFGWVASRRERPDRMPEVTDEAAGRVEAGEFPRWSALVEAGWHRGEVEQEFEVGLALLLDGIAAAVERGAMPGLPAGRRRARG